MKHISAYLKNLKFDNTLLKTPIAKYFTNLRLILLIVIGIILFGAISFNKLPRNLFPDVNIPTIIVTTILPGANPQDMESLVSIPIEDAVSGLSKVKTVTSNSLESVSSVAVEFETGADLERAKTDVQSAVDSISGFPDNAQKPNVLKIDLQKTPIWTFAITGNSDKASLIRFAKKLKQDLTDLSSIDNITVNGLEEQEIQIIIDPQKISTFNINPQQLIAAVKSSLKSFPAGNVNTNSSTFSLTINPTVTTIDDIRRLSVNLNGNIMLLSDIAQVFEKSKPNQFPSFIAKNNSPTETSVIFNVFRVTTVNILNASKDAQDLVEQKVKKENGKFKLFSIMDSGKMIEDQFGQLQKDLIATILLVAIVLFIFLGAKQAFVALLATPLTFLISFIVMDLTGIALSFISLFALLLSLGLLVDDTIVVVSSVTAYYRSGKFTPQQAGLLVFRDLIIAILTTTVTTIWAFLPLLVSSGIIGEFIKPIPIVVSTTLAGSFLVAIFITLPFIIFLLKPSIPKRVIILSRIIIVSMILGLIIIFLPKNGLLSLQIIFLFLLILVTYFVRTKLKTEIKKHTKFKITKVQKQKIFDYLEYGILSFQKIEYHYSRLILKILNSKSARKKIIILVVIFSIFSYLLVPFGFVKNEFFPKDDSDTLSVSVELPTGTNLNTTKVEALNILKTLNKTPYTKYVLLSFGASGGNFSELTSSGENSFSYTLIFEENKKRKLSSFEIAESIRNDFKSYSKGVFAVKEQSGGPPAGSDIQIKLFGSDLVILDTYANKIEKFLKNEPGATNVQKSIKPGISKIVFTPDEQKVSKQNLTLDTLGFWLRLFATGFKIDTLKIDPSLNISEDITLRMYNKLPNAEDITDINIPSQNGLVPLTSLGKLNLKPNPTLISREDGKRTISITAGVKKGYNIPDINKKLENYAEKSLNLPSEYSWETGGVNEENSRSIGSIFQAMLISILLIIITMVLQFNSFRRAFIVIAVIPLAVSGVFIIFSLTQTALSFPALVGVLALFGIVVKNSILIMDKILANIATGMEFSESIADAAASRLEPIALTSITAIVGLIPITLSDPLWRGLGGAIIAGLTFSGTIMLFFIPVIYYIVYKPKK